MSKRRRRTNFTAEQKVAIVREHLLEGVAVSAGVPRPRRPRARASGNPCGRTRTGPSTSAISTSAAPSYYLCSILDGASRSIVHWEIREAMTEADVEIIVQRARELYAEAGHTRIISDNGPQFIGRDFKLFVRELGLEHVRTSPYYPQWNGTKERFYQTLKGECLRPQTLLTLEDARRVVARFVAFYNEVRLHSAIGYITPQGMPEGRAEEIHAERDRKLEEARERHRRAQQQAVPA